MVLLAAGCATPTEQACRSADWYRLGRLDGFEGYPPGRLDARRETCAEYGIVPDAAAWFAGHEQGLGRYCTPQRGFEVGREGGNYRRVCPPLDEPDFIRGFLLGRDVYRDRQSLDRLEAEIRETEDRLAATAGDEPEREALRGTIRRLEEDRDELRRQLRNRQDRARELGYRQDERLR